MRNNVKYFIFPRSILVLDVDDFSQRIKVKIVKSQIWGSVLFIEFSLGSLFSIL